MIQGDFGCGRGISFKRSFRPVARGPGSGP